MVAGVAGFDTDNDGSASDSGQLGVGQATFEGFDVQRGGGIAQVLDLVDGDLFISADVASEFGYPFCNDDGGTIELLVDGLAADRESFGRICGPATAVGELRASVKINSIGSHEIRLPAPRGFVHEVEALSGKQRTSETADHFIAAAERIHAVLSC